MLLMGGASWACGGGVTTLMAGRLLTLAVPYLRGRFFREAA